MSDLVYAPCEHGYWDRHLRYVLIAERLEGSWCDGRRPLGKVEDIERALHLYSVLLRAGDELVSMQAKAAAYDNAERVEWEHAGDWHRLVPEIGDTE